ncbi:hypothetical protein ACFVAE_06910 [Microbacterium sp. NPDC057659]|uniref:hypothetical protein n=1 Tax=Microbacterium sp. NPDC057659 TaxID=3346198 RepID=UPI00366D881B
MLAAAVAASALLIGVGAGWLLFGRDAGPAMSAAQQKAWAEFEASGKYDEGSIRMVGERYGITAWYATKKELALECIMLTPAPTATVGCAPPPDPKKDEEGYWGQLSVQLELDKPKGTMVQAAIVRDTRGEPVAVLDRWDPGPQDSWTNMFQGTELDIAKAIVKETGVDGGALQIIGYDGDTPIWFAQDGNNCVYVADTSKVLLKGCGVDMFGGTTEFGGDGVTYSVRGTERGPVLTVIRGGDPADPSIDDTTGEISE